jgi:AraC-like DNA-binding protein
VDQRIEIDIIIMRREAHRNLQIREVAQRVNLSLGHFIRLFKAQTDISPKGYLRRLKIEKAQELLNKTFMSIKEIAANVGFGDRSHAEPKQFLPWVNARNQICQRIEGSGAEACSRDRMHRSSPNRPTALDEFSQRFFSWVDDARLENKTKKYY